MNPQWIPKLLIIKAILLTLLCGGCQAQTIMPSEEGASASNGSIYYVAPTGNDLNPGTEAQPWQTIQKAAESLTPGDTVYIKAGTYQERVVPHNPGSADNYIVYAAYPSDMVIIDGASINTPEWGGLFDITDKDYIRVSGLRIMNAGPGPHNPGILVEQSNHIVIENNYVYNTSDSGIGVWNSKNVSIDNNEVEWACYAGYNESISIGGTDGFEVKRNHVHHSQKEGIDVKDGSSNGQVFKNHVHHTEAVGIYVDAWDKHTYNIEVFENIVHDIADSNGLSLASEKGGKLENIRIYNNIAYHNRYCGLSISTNGPGGPQGEHPMNDIQVINNTFYNNGWETWGGGITVDNPEAQKVVIRNNISSQNLYFQIAVGPGVLVENVTIDHNLVDGYRGTEGEIYGYDYIEGDPKFVYPAGVDFHLQQDSPAIDQGFHGDAPATDFEGQPRPYGAEYDIGADEYVVSTGCTAPPAYRPAGTAPGRFDLGTTRQQGCAEICVRCSRRSILARRSRRRD